MGVRLCLATMSPRRSIPSPGLIAFELGRVPLPGSYVEYGGLKFTAEGSRDRRGRMRVLTVVVEPIVADHSEEEETDGQS